MEFYDVVDQVIALLERRGRLSYRALKRQFTLDDAGLEDLKFELVDVQRVAVDEEGAILVWANAPPRSPAQPGSDPTPSSRPAPPPSAETPAPATPPAAEDAERRQLSVLFCDLVGSTTLAAQLDPEELRDVLHAYQTVCADLIERFGGVLARQVGDGLLVNFGYPQAHEDDAARAVRAGLAIVAALPDLNARLALRVAALRAHPLQVRIGLHTGLVVVGTLGDSTYRDPMAVVGETPNIAARLQGLATPNTVVVSGATYRLLGDAFMAEDLGLHELKGVATPVAVYRVRGEGAGSPEGSAGRRVTPLVGREQEVGVLLNRWEQSTEGMGQMVLLSGEAGIGKSRLVQELRARLASVPHIRLEGRGSAYHQQSAFFPLADLLQRALRFDAGDAAEVKLAKLEEALRQQGLPVEDMVPFFASLLGLPAPSARQAAQVLTPQRHRRQTVEALLALVLGLAGQQPVLMIVEDLHWVDPSTLEVLDLLLEQAPTVRLLLVLTARPDFRAPWGSRAHLTRLTLTRLRRPQVEQLTAAVTGGKALPPEVVEQVAGKTDGVPLFVEELIKMVLETGLVREGPDGYELSGPLPPLAIPTTLQDSLMARLDRLATTRVVVQLGATLGRSFSYRLLHAVAGLDEETLTRELGKLVETELLYQRGLPPEATYSFKHALIQDAAYQTLLRSTRQQYHQRVAQVLEAEFPETRDGQPEVLAHHYTEARLAAPAIAAWQRAGQRAIERSANLEGIAHLSRGLELLATLADAPDRVQRELDLQTILAPALMATRGYAAPQVEAAYGRARELCRQVGETPRLIRVLLGLSTFYFIRGELETAQELGAECLPMIERLNDLPRLLQAHLGLGSTLFHLGDFAGARTHLEQGLATSDTHPNRSRPIPAVADPQVVCLCYSAKALWVLGFPDQALARSRAALALAQELGHPYSHAIAVHLAGWFYQMRRDVAAAQRQAEAGIQVSGEQGFSLWLAQGHTVRGWALAQAGDPEGAVELHQGYDAWRATGAELAAPHYLGMLADSYLALGRPDEGLRAVDEALALAQKTRENWGDADLHRLRGELLAQRSAADCAEAETCFHGALQIARAQGARSWALRAAIGLTRLEERRGARGVGRGALADVYASFTEGFETPDLCEARALLEARS